MPARFWNWKERLLPVMPLVMRLVMQQIRHKDCRSCFGAWARQRSTCVDYQAANEFIDWQKFSFAPASMVCLVPGRGMVLLGILPG